MKTKFSIPLIMCILSANIVFAQDVFKTQIGEYVVYTLSEGQQQGSSKILLNTTPEMLQQTAPDGVFPNAVNAFLIQNTKEGINILVDAGFGRKLFDNLKSIGVEPKDISTVLITHAHGDHIGGLVRDGKPSFPNAVVYISEKENDYWVAEGNKNYLAVREAYKNMVVSIEPN
ncbi:MAG: MBL fold metallo-hydrolase, partial [Paludibacter sp.]|nr:MBL fold metallo-hydrolase [Paludibacter sp.]